MFKVIRNSEAAFGSGIVLSVSHSYMVHLFVQVSFKLKELIFGGDSQQLHQIQFRDVKIELSVEPFVFKGSLCDTFTLMPLDC